MAANSIPATYKLITDRANWSEAWNICGAMRDKKRAPSPPSPWRRKGRGTALVLHASLQGSRPPTNRTFSAKWKEIKSPIRWRILSLPCFSEPANEKANYSQYWGTKRADQGGQLQGWAFHEASQWKLNKTNLYVWSWLVVVPSRLFHALGGGINS